MPIYVMQTVTMLKQSVLYVVISIFSKALSFSVIEEWKKLHNEKLLVLLGNSFKKWR
jgi:hypothetical protein